MHVYLGKCISCGRQNRFNFLITDLKHNKNMKLSEKIHQRITKENKKCGVHLVGENVSYYIFLSAVIITKNVTVLLYFLFSTFRTKTCTNVFNVLDTSKVWIVRVPCNIRDIKRVHCVRVGDVIFICGS